ncbi:MAG: diadenylate cyclase CdaA, partial [Bacteroidota bacterium]|nr:diadenylate cyclase CdaA [Bacteroidota bacterium]
DIFDIVLVAILLYYIYRLVKGTAAINIFTGIVIVYLIWKLTDILQMNVLSNILGGFISVGVFALIVVFQQEIRKLLLTVGSTNLANPKNFRRYWNILTNNEYRSKSEAKIVVNACAELSAQNIGALIVFERNTSLDIFKESGDKVNMDISTPVIESIFFKGGPLHDGAIVIDGNRIVATRVALPISEQSDIPVRYGLRHRAAVGVSEKTDASVIVVSEETGKISYIKNGEFISFSSNDNLIEIIEEDLS